MQGEHITVCVCTYQRPLCLQRLLEELATQCTNGLFTYSVVVADNDREESARGPVSAFAETSRIPITYCVQPQRGISLTRNTAVQHAAGSFVAFIDDDEFPDRHWLVTLFTACQQNRVDGVVGPVLRHFDQQPPAWVIRGRFYERPTYTTGVMINWLQGRTNNVLVRAAVLRAAGEQPFRPEFRTGEDQDFFRRMIDAGYRFIWCNEGIVYETVPPVRWKRTFMARRALLQGADSVLHRTVTARSLIKSVIAIVGYTAALPFTLPAQHVFMTVLIKLCDHTGRVLAYMDVQVVKEPYVTQ